LHGGAGRPSPDLTDKQKATYKDSLAAALRVGIDVLKDGGTSLDAVEQVVRYLEDDPLFNAGKGAVFNIDGGHELHASIMDGATLDCGAVAAVDTVRNPISLARLVMTDTPFILLIGEGAEQFAVETGIEPVPSTYFDTDFRRQRWKNAREDVGLPIDSTEDLMGTVGCVALDKHSNLAAATSTGGVAHKRFGRMGDSSIIGAGNYANSNTCAVSCTGIGEHFIRHVVAYDVSALLEYKELSLKDAASRVVSEKLPPNTGGLIAISHDGTIVMQSNRGGMRRAAADSTGRFEVSFWE
jgi:beta-aspartyl-peptidase (threonine type)